MKLVAKLTTFLIFAAISLNAQAVMLSWELTDPDSGTQATFVYEETVIDGILDSRDLISITGDFGDGIFTYNFNTSSVLFTSAYDTADLSLISWTSGGSFLNSLNSSSSGVLSYSHTWWDESTFMLGNVTIIADWNGSGLELASSTDLNAPNISVPAPAPLTLLGLGLVAIGFTRKRKV